MATTSKGLWYPDGSTPVNLQTILQQMQDSVNPTVSYRMNRNRYTVGISNGNNSSGAYAVSWSGVGFTQPPVVLLGVEDTTNRAHATYANVTTSGCDIYLHRPGTSGALSRVVSVLAVQATSASATG